MRPGMKWLGVVVGVLTIIGLVLAFRFVRATNLLGTIEEIDASCRAIQAVPGPEDIVIDRERGLAFVSATDRWGLGTVGSTSPNSLLDSMPDSMGGLYRIDLNRPVDEWVLTDVTPASLENFRPHGLGLFVGEDGTRSLFVVNHPAEGPDEVVMLDLDESGALTHRRTVSDPLMVNLNDVQPVGHDRFYATNDHGAGISAALQDFLLLDQTDLIYFDGAQTHVAAQDLTFANGVNVSGDGRQIYLTETLDRVLRIYDRDVETGVLDLVDVVELGASPDNIDVLESGDLLIGAHPKVLEFASHAGDPNVVSPSQVIRLSRNDAGEWSLRTIFEDSGDQISGVAVAAGYHEWMLLGPVFQSRILVCQQAGAS